MHEVINPQILDFELMSFIDMFAIFVDKSFSSTLGILKVAFSYLILNCMEYTINLEWISSDTTDRFVWPLILDSPKIA